ncbi:hypothetical protein FIV31_01195 [Coxiella endosymbiont of Ornithodoros amblus]|uniref:hypothetical protein n=1 Tax=Coxiella endosymbiont of Ornithodoros amblus TaxID=1656166 RepID=UPI00244DB0C0|nr:hypothetical protein [Coxiella endosymbiont of Ornithodoros amblus]MBW5802375.1 hypothetical protein [Coxiella endosymbiont of Ornithodoros amblus]
MLGSDKLNPILNSEEIQKTPREKDGFIFAHLSNIELDLIHQNLIIELMEKKQYENYCCKEIKLSENEVEKCNFIYFFYFFDDLFITYYYYRAIQLLFCNHTLSYNNLVLMRESCDLLELEKHDLLIHGICKHIDTDRMAIVYAMLMNNHGKEKKQVDLPSLAVIVNILSSTTDYENLRKQFSFLPDELGFRELIKKLENELSALLYYAVQSDSILTLKEVLELGSNINATYQSESILKLAFEKETSVIAFALIKNRERFSFE